MEVKGSYIVDFVKVIKANPDKDFSKWLMPEDRQVIDAMIMPSMWYPFGAYKRMGQAIFMEIANQNQELTRAFGRLISQGHLELYQHMLVEGEPTATLEKFILIRSNWFRGIGSNVVMEEKGPNWMKVKLTLAPEDQIETEEAFACLLAGHIDTFLEASGAKNPKVSYSKQGQVFNYSIVWD